MSGGETKDSSVVTNQPVLSSNDTKEEQTEVRSPPQVNHVGVVPSRSKSDNSVYTTCTVLRTAKVKVCGEQGQCVAATVLFDNGSDRSYVSSIFLKKVRPKWVCSEPVSYSAFGNKTTRGHMCNIYDFCIKDRTVIG